MTVALNGIHVEVACQHYPFIRPHPFTGVGLLVLVVCWSLSCSSHIEGYLITNLYSSYVGYVLAQVETFTF